VKTWHWIALALLTVATIIGQFIESRYWWERIPGFFAVFGFIGCWLLIFGAKILGNLMIYQKPDYYDKIALVADQKEGQKDDQKDERNTDAHH